MHGIENSRFRGRKMKLFDLKWIVKLFQETYNFTRKIYHRYFFILNISSPIFLRIKSYIIQRWKMLLGNHELLFSNILQNVKPSTATHVVEQQRHFNITSFISMQTMQLPSVSSTRTCLWTLNFPNQFSIRVSFYKSEENQKLQTILPHDHPLILYSPRNS